MQASECFSDILTSKKTINFRSYIFLRPIFEKWINSLYPKQRKKYLRAHEFINCLSRIPEIRLINNLILPSCIIGVYKDIDYLLPIFTQASQLWQIYNSFRWIDFSGANIYQHKYLYGLQLIILELIKHCKWVIVSVPQFMTISEFWDWLLKCNDFNTETREQIIFFTAKQAITYKTFAASGSIPMNIAQNQNKFYTEEYGLDKNIIATSVNCNQPRYVTCYVESQPDDIQPTDLASSDKDKCIANLAELSNKPIGQIGIEQPLIINEIDKLRLELIKYNMEFPGVLDVEAGAILEKINDIRNILGISHDKLLL